jgi:hypothetical protein
VRVLHVPRVNIPIDHAKPSSPPAVFRSEAETDWFRMRKSPSQSPLNF